MEENRNSYNVFKKIEKSERKNWKLYIDAEYKSDPNSKNISGEVLSKLLGIKNQGGFRYLGKTNNPNLVVLYSSGEDVYWKDELDETLGIYIYYGDNKKPGTDLHKTNLHGNEILRDIFLLASSNDSEQRKKIPPVLVFKKTCGRNVKFLGLAVPGMKGKPAKEWLTAVWGSNKNKERFLNYRAYFTILNTVGGCEAENNFGINLAWLNDIEKGNAYSSAYAPREWKKYIDNSNYAPLLARSEKSVRSKEEQLPKEKFKQRMLTVLHDYFINKDGGYSFEPFAVDMTRYIDESVVDINVTRPFKDGGVDGIGLYKLFNYAENSVYVDFYLQAKCYSQNNAVTVKDTSRLISRIKDRQFGIMFTTSYVAQQAYEEILDDGHPIVIISGRNIIDFIFDKLEIRSIEDLAFWLEKNY